MDNNHTDHNASQRRSYVRWLRPSVMWSFMLRTLNSLVIVSLLLTGLAPALVQAAAADTEYFSNQSLDSSSKSQESSLI